MHDPDQDEIRYEAVPGFRTVFFAALILAAGYLALITIGVL